MKAHWLAIGVVIAASVVGSFGSLYLKRAADRFKLSYRGIFKNKPLILGGSLLVFSYVLFIPMLKYADLSVLYPISALAYVWICFISKKYLEEEINKFKWIGVFLILLGVVLII